MPGNPPEALSSVLDSKQTVQLGVKILRLRFSGPSLEIEEKAKKQAKKAEHAIAVEQAKNQTKQIFIQAFSSNVDSYFQAQPRNIAYVDSIDTITNELGGIFSSLTGKNAQKFVIDFQTSLQQADQGAVEEIKHLIKEVFSVEIEKDVSEYMQHKQLQEQSIDSFCREAYVAINVRNQLKEIGVTIKDDDLHRYVRNFLYWLPAEEKEKLFRPGNEKASNSFCKEVYVAINIRNQLEEINAGIQKNGVFVDVTKFLDDSVESSERGNLSVESKNEQKQPSSERFNEGFFEGAQKFLNELLLTSPKSGAFNLGNQAKQRRLCGEHYIQIEVSNTLKSMGEVVDADELQRDVHEFLKGLPAGKAADLFKFTHKEGLNSLCEEVFVAIKIRNQLKKVNKLNIPISDFCPYVHAFLKDLSPTEKVGLLQAEAREKVTSFARETYVAIDIGKRFKESDEKLSTEILQRAVRELFSQLSPESQTDFFDPKNTKSRLNLFCREVYVAIDIRKRLANGPIYKGLKELRQDVSDFLGGMPPEEGNRFFKSPNKEVIDSLREEIYVAILVRDRLIKMNPDIKMGELYPYVDHFLEGLDERSNEALFRPGDNKKLDAFCIEVYLAIEVRNRLKTSGIDRAAIDLHEDVRGFLEKLPKGREASMFQPGHKNDLDAFCEEVCKEIKGDSEVIKTIETNVVAQLGKAGIRESSSNIQSDIYDFLNGVSPQRKRALLQAGVEGEQFNLFCGEIYLAIYTREYLKKANPYIRMRDLCPYVASFPHELEEAGEEKLAPQDEEKSVQPGNNEKLNSFCREVYVAIDIRDRLQASVVVKTGTELQKLQNDVCPFLNNLLPLEQAELFLPQNKTKLALLCEEIYVAIEIKEWLEKSRGGETNIADLRTDVRAFLNSLSSREKESLFLADNRKKLDLFRKEVFAVIKIRNYLKDKGLDINMDDLCTYVHWLPINKKYELFRSQENQKNLALSCKEVYVAIQVRNQLRQINVALRSTGDLQSEIHNLLNKFPTSRTDSNLLAADGRENLNALCEKCYVAISIKKGLEKQAITIDLGDLRDYVNGLLDGINQNDRADLLPKNEADLVSFCRAAHVVMYVKGRLKALDMDVVEVRDLHKCAHNCLERLSEEERDELFQGNRETKRISFCEKVFQAIDVGIQNGTYNYDRHAALYAPLVQVGEGEDEISEDHIQGFAADLIDRMEDLVELSKEHGFDFKDINFSGVQQLYSEGHLSSFLTRNLWPKDEEEQETIRTFMALMLIGAFEKNPDFALKSKMDIREILLSFYITARRLRLKPHAEQNALLSLELGREVGSGRVIRSNENGVLTVLINKSGDKVQSEALIKKSRDSIEERRHPLIFHLLITLFFVTVAVVSAVPLLSGLGALLLVTVGAPVALLVSITGMTLAKKNALRPFLLSTSFLSGIATGILLFFSSSPVYLLFLSTSPVFMPVAVGLLMTGFLGGLAYIGYRFINKLQSTLPTSSRKQAIGWFVLFLAFALISAAAATFVVYAFIVPFFVFPASLLVILPLPIMFVVGMALNIILLGTKIVETAQEARIGKDNLFKEWIWPQIVEEEELLLEGENPDLDLDNANPAGAEVAPAELDEASRGLNDEHGVPKAPVAPPLSEELQEPALKRRSSAALRGKGSMSQNADLRNQRKVSQDEKVQDAELVAQQQLPAEADQENEVESVVSSATSASQQSSSVRSSLSNQPPEANLSRSSSVAAGKVKAGVRQSGNPYGMAMFNRPPLEGALSPDAKFQIIYVEPQKKKKRPQRGLSNQKVTSKEMSSSVINLTLLQSLNNNPPWILSAKYSADQILDAIITKIEKPGVTAQVTKTELDNGGLKVNISISSKQKPKQMPFVVHIFDKKIQRSAGWETQKLDEFTANVNKKLEPLEEFSEIDASLEEVNPNHRPASRVQ